jgi:hypothetical protein
LALRVSARAIFRASIRFFYPSNDILLAKAKHLPYSSAADARAVRLYRLSPDFFRIRARLSPLRVFVVAVFAETPPCSGAIVSRADLIVRAAAFRATPIRVIFLFFHTSIIS